MDTSVDGIGGGSVSARVAFVAGSLGVVVTGFAFVANRAELADQPFSSVALAMWLLGLTAILAVATAVYVELVLLRDVRRVTQLTRDLEAGDLTQPNLEGGTGEVAQLIAATNGVAEALRMSVRAIQLTSMEILNNVSEVTGATAMLSASANEQASAIAETSTTVEEIKRSGERARETAQGIVEASGTSVEVSEEGITALGATVEEMRRIKEQVEAIVAGVELARKEVSVVGEIINSVNDVAEQSNLLAVNASIEAAKAGEFGRGFSVVAQEVKSLSEQSKQATAKVRQALGSIQGSIDRVVSAAYDGRERSDQGVDSVENSGGVISRLAETILQAAGGAKDISLSANEQVVALEQIALAMADINKSATENLKVVEQVNLGEHKLAAMSKELQSLTGSYRLGE